MMRTKEMSKFLDPFTSPVAHRPSFLDELEHRRRDIFIEKTIPSLLFCFSAARPRERRRNPRPFVARTILSAG